MKIYFNGAPQPMSGRVDTLQNTIRTEVPLKIAQRHNSSQLERRRDARPADLWPGAGRRRSRAIGQGHPGRLSGRPNRPPSGARPKRPRSLAGGSRALDKPTLELTGQLARLEREEKEIKARGTVAHVMQERTEPAMAFVLFRGDYDKRRDQVSPGTPAALPPMPADLPRNRLGFCPVAAAARNIR